jgi:uncharacterized delta-60 repeat protein
MNCPLTPSAWRTRRLVCVGAATAAAVLLAAPAATAPGRSASGLGPGSALVNGVRSKSYDEASTVAIQRDGKIVAAGASSCGHDGCTFLWDGFALARYLPNGRLDPSFGRGGKVLTEGRADEARAVAIQDDGKVVVASGDVGTFTLARYARGGRLDASFGRGGIAQPVFRKDCLPAARAAALQADGKIVVTGICDADELNGFITARYLRDGRLDPSFGTGGSVLTDFGSDRYTNGRAVRIQNDGKILVAGESQSESVRTVGFALARYLPDGHLDPSFGTGGKVLDVPGAANALALLPDGKIVAGGDGVARYRPEGTLDPGFGSGGKISTDFSVSGLEIQGNGKVVIAGSTKRGDHYEFALRRYSSDGSPDMGFGSGGAVVTHFGRRTSDFAGEVAVQGNGKIVLAGGSEPRVGGPDFALARYTASGHLDPRFGKAGTVLTDFRGVTGFASFSATRTKRGVLLRWRTIWEEGIRGFHLYRERINKPTLRITRKLIASKGSTSRGASYSFRERGAPRGAYRYFMQEVRRDGKRIFRGQTAVKR